MSDKLQALIYDIWESACQDAPIRPSGKVENGQFVMTITGNRDNWANLVQRAGVPDHAVQTIDGDTLTVRWPSLADEIFGADGLIAQRLDNYEVRLPQLYMARMVQRAIEMDAPAMVEAGTGVGKSYAYAAICMMMGKRCVISTSNKALQMQLWKKDLPFLQSIFPGKKAALAVGKSNFACRQKCESNNGDILIPDGNLAEWYAFTSTGNTEEITFPVDYKTLKGVTVDDECTAKHCPFYYNCFYYSNRDDMKRADVIICNHALLCINQVAGGNVLPPVDVTVVDEAHKLPDYARNALGAEFTFTAIEKAIHLAREATAHLTGDQYDSGRKVIEIEDGPSSLIGIVSDALFEFEREVRVFLGSADVKERQVLIRKDRVMNAGRLLGGQLLALANDVWPEDEMPRDNEDEIRLFKRANRIRSMGNKVGVISLPNDLVRWVEPESNNEPLKLCAQPSNVAAFIGQLAGVYTEVDAPQRLDYTHCTRCSRQLTAKTVHLLDGKPFGPDCIQHVDPYGDADVVELQAWLAAEHTPQDTPERTGMASRATIFTSATLAAPDLAHFLRICGLPDALQMQAQSPFDYENNALIYLPSGTSPAPNEPTWMLWMFDQVRQLVLAADGGAFLLFTSYNAMTQALNELRYTFTTRGMTVLVQGEMPKLEIAKRFKAEKRAVLFATKSFWEGVDIQGDALRLVVVDRIPFRPTSPLTTALEADILERARANGLTGKALEMAPFYESRLPDAIIDLKQALGRLIRTSTDRGAMAILDSRVRSLPYGRNIVMPSIPPAPVTSHIESVRVFMGTTVLQPLPEKRQHTKIEPPIMPVGLMQSDPNESPF